MRTENSGAVTYRNTNTSQKKAKTSSAPETAFGKTFESLMGRTKAQEKASEEELFAGALGQQIKDQFGVNVFKDFQISFKIGMTERAPGHSLPSAERAAKLAVRDLVNSQQLTREQAISLKSIAFEAAQLDGNADALYDGIGGGLEIRR